MRMLVGGLRNELARGKNPIQTCLVGKRIHWFMEINSFCVLIKDHFVLIKISKAYKMNTSLELINLCVNL